MKKRFMATLLILCMALTLLPITATAAPGDSVSDPIIITTAAQLNNVRNNLTAYYKLASDIDLTDWLNANGGTTGWEPIGTYDEGDVTKGFTGKFDGAGYRISGLWIYKPNSNEVGLFGCAYTGTEIRNLGVEIAAKGVNGASDVGGLVGSMGGGLIRKCYVTGAVTGSNYVGGIGGLVGGNYAGTIEACYAMGSVAATSISANVGGLVGQNYGGTIEHCYATSKVTGNNYVGGLIGVNYHDSAVIECYFDMATTGKSVGAGNDQGNTPADITGKTTADMQQATKFPMWDFVNTWDIYEGADYPRLRVFEFPKTDPVVTTPAPVVTTPKPVVTTTGNAAAIGGVEYNTLEDAIGAVPQGQTIKLLRDITVPSGEWIDLGLNFSEDSVNEYSIELGNFKINGNCEGALLCLMRFVIVHIYAETGGIKNAREDGIVFAIDDPGALLNINGGTYEGGDDAIYCRSGSVLISGGTFIATAGTNEDGCIVTELGGEIIFSLGASINPANWAETRAEKVTVNQDTVTPALPSNPFRDIGEHEWYYSNVLYAYDLGLINGKTPTEFKPDVNLTYAEAVKLAACMHELYTTGKITPGSGEPWYQCYVDYAKVNNIIGVDYAWDTPATRAGYMAIFANALPYAALSAINSIADGAIPDVPATHPYAAEIYRLYRAGIVRGVDNVFSCNPSANIKRSEVAAVLTRMMDPTARVTFSIG